LHSGVLQYNVPGLDSFVNRSYEFSTGYNDSPYGEYRTVRPYVDDIMRKILGDSWRREEDSTSNEERVIYANTSRTSICDDGVAKSSNVEIPEGIDESAFVEKTLAPSGRPWISVPSLSERILMMSTVTEGGEVEIEGEGDGGADDSSSMSDSRRAAVVDWLKGSTDGGGESTVSAAAVVPFGIGSAAATSTVQRLTPVRSETTVREETRTTVETLGGGQRGGRQVPILRNGEDKEKGSGERLNDRSSLFHRTSIDTKDFRDEHATSGDSWRSHEADDKVRISRQQPSSAAAVAVSSGDKTRERSHDDVIWIPVVHVPDPAAAGRSGVAADGSESSKYQRVLSASSWSTELPPAIPPTASTKTAVPPVQTVSDASKIAHSGITVTRETNSASPTIVRPTAVIASGSGGNRQPSAPSPTTAAIGRETGTYSSSISLHATPKATADRGFVSVAHTSVAAVGDSSARGGTLHDGSSGGNGSSTSGFRSVTVSGGARNGPSVSAGSLAAAAESSGNVGTFRSETCFSVDAVGGADASGRGSRPAAENVVSFGSEENRTRTIPVAASVGFRQTASGASAAGATTASSRLDSGRSFTYRQSNGESSDGTKQLSSTAASTTDADDGDWVIEKALR
jgi:hypothetical protein